MKSQKPKALKARKNLSATFTKARGSKSRPDVFIYTVDEQTKVPYVSYLLQKIWDRRYVCFCPDMKTARELYTDNPLGSCCIASCTRNNRHLKSFNDYNRDHLLLTKAINADTEYKDVECLVFVNPDATPYTVQTFAKRLCSPNPKIYFFVHGPEECENAEFLSSLTDCDTLTRFHFTRGIINNHQL